MQKKVEKMLKIAYFQHFFDDIQHFFNIFFSTFFAFLKSPVNALLNGLWLQSSFLINGRAIEVLRPPKLYI